MVFLVVRHKLLGLVRSDALDKSNHKAFEVILVGLDVVDAVLDLILFIMSKTTINKHKSSRCVMGFWV